MLVVGIDQSYKRTGICISYDGKPYRYKSIDFKNIKSKTEKRNLLRKEIYKILYTNDNVGIGDLNAKEDMMIICERIRLRSQGFLNIDYIKSTASLIDVIVDTAYEFNVPVYSVDTRSWKAQIVGTSKGSKIIQNGKVVKNNKLNTLEFVRNVLEIDCGKNDDKADAICISLYGFIDKEKQKLKQET